MFGIKLVNDSNCGGGPHERLWIESHKQRILVLPCNRGIVNGGVINMTMSAIRFQLMGFVWMLRIQEKEAIQSIISIHLQFLQWFWLCSCHFLCPLLFSLSSLIVGQSNPSSCVFFLLFSWSKIPSAVSALHLYPFLFHPHCHPLSLFPVFSGCLRIQSQSLDVSWNSSMFCKVNDWNKNSPIHQMKKMLEK